MAQRGFRLHQVLEHKRRIEDQKQLELRALLSEEDALRAAIEALHVRVASHVADMGERVKGGLVDPGDLESDERYLEQLEVRVEERRTELAETAVRVAASRAELVTALQERRALELLQERQEAEARREAGRRETREVDDIVSARFVLGQIARREDGAST